MGNHTKENKNKKKQLKLDSAKTSFVAGIIVFITIFKDLLEYLESELPLWLNGVYASVCLILVVLAFGTKILDKPLKYLQFSPIKSIRVCLDLARVDFKNIFLVFTRITTGYLKNKNVKNRSKKIKTN